MMETPLISPSITSEDPGVNQGFPLFRHKGMPDIPIITLAVLFFPPPEAPPAVTEEADLGTNSRAVLVRQGATTQSKEPGAS
jgi:hypothetical protein